MTPEPTPQPPVNSQPWTFGRIAFLTFRILWSVIAAQAAAGILAQDTAIPAPIIFLAVWPVAWWLSGSFRSWARPEQAAQQSMLLGRAAKVFVRGVWSLIAAMVFPNLVIPMLGVPATLAWAGGLVVGCIWFVACRGYMDGGPVARTLGPASVPLALAALSVLVRFSSPLSY